MYTTIPQRAAALEKRVANLERILVCIRPVDASGACALPAGSIIRRPRQHATQHHSAMRKSHAVYWYGVMQADVAGVEEVAPVCEPDQAEVLTAGRICCDTNGMCTPPSGANAPLSLFA